MKNVVSKIVNHIIENKYHMFSDVEVTSERDYNCFYTDLSKCIYYNVFLTKEGYTMKGNEWDKIKSEIRQIIKMASIDNQINFYIVPSNKD